MDYAWDYVWMTYGVVRAVCKAKGKGAVRAARAPVRLAAGLPVATVICMFLGSYSSPPKLGKNVMMRFVSFCSTYLLHAHPTSCLARLYGCVR